MGNASVRIRLETAPDVDVLLKRHSRARRMSLRVSSLDGRVTLTLPMHAGDREAARFAQSHADWIKGALAKQSAPVPVALGAEIPVEGVARKIVTGTGRSARVSGAEIAAPPGREIKALQALLKSLARDRLVEASDTYASKLGQRYGKVSLRDTRSRWGSCSSSGDLMYSWRLIMAPREVLTYVAAHEVAHLAEMNHSQAFWALVRSLDPDFERPRKWLREEGHLLHRYRFEDAVC